MKILAVKAIMKLSLVFTLCLCLDCTSGRTIDSIIASASSLGTIKSGMKQDTAGSAVLTELDILLTPDQYNALYSKHNTAHANSSTTSAREKREDSRPLYKRWPNKRVPYRIEAGQFSNRDQRVIKAAIDDWEKYTCITFPLATDDDVNFINFTGGTSCASFIGMFGGNQSVFLGIGCRYKQVIIHEIGHAVGFIHEQCRPDRDDLVTIKEENIRPNSVSNFAKDKFSVTTSFGVPYDYTSIMHYGGTAFSRNGKPTIVTRDPAFQEVIGNQKTLSFNDIKLANLMYNCNEHCNSPITCPKEGFLGKDCQCWCHGDPVKKCKENISTDSTPVKPTLKPTEGPTTRPTMPPTSTTKCEDLDPDCIFFAMLGDCQGNDYVKKYCKASCSLCEGDIVTGRPPVKSTLEPTEGPTTKPTEGPITRPTERPTTKPTEGSPTRPTGGPTTRPTEGPTTRPSERPTTRPTEGPPTRPTEGSTTRPTEEPTTTPTEGPTTRPSRRPTTRPTMRKTTRSTERQTSRRTERPPTKPTERRTTRPTERKTTRPTEGPTTTPTEGPTTRPSRRPTTRPTMRKTTRSTERQTSRRTERPPTKPTERRTTRPTERKTTRPTEGPTTIPACTDMDHVCPIWAKHNYCKNSPYMQKYCKASCSLCEGDIVTERSPVKSTLKPTEGPTTRPTEGPTTKPTQGPTRTRETNNKTLRGTNNETNRGTNETHRGTNNKTYRGTNSETHRGTNNETQRRPTTKPTEGPTTRPREDQQQNQQRDQQRNQHRNQREPQRD